MKRLGVLLLTLAGLTVLFGSCGGGEKEADILSVAFLLDEGSPFMVAYIGDPTEDSFEIPAGRYYIEALDGNEVLISLGAVDMEAGDVVDFPTSFEAADGIVDAEQAEPLTTVARFLVDVELAKYEFLEIVTGGFSESPFDPAVELDEADFQNLFEMYGGIGAQEDVVLDALSEIERRAKVSLGVSYVRSPWAPLPGDFDGLSERAALIFAVLTAAIKLSEDPDMPAAPETAILAYLALQDLEAQVSDKGDSPEIPDETLAAYSKLLDKKSRWRQYAKTLGDDLPSLEEKIKSDIKELCPGLTSEQIDDFTKYYVGQTVKAVPKLATAPPPVAAEPEEEEGPEPTAPEPKPDTSWIDGYVQAQADRWRTEGHSDEAVEEWAGILRQCLTDRVVKLGFDKEGAKAACPLDLYEPPPEEEEPPPQPTQGHTAEGTYTYTYGKVLGNTIWLDFNTTDGGTVTGEGHLRQDVPSAECGAEIDDSKFYYTGTYDEASKTFEGTYYVVSGGSQEIPVCDEHGCTCQVFPREGITQDLPWEATLEDGVVRSTVGPLFVLSVQGQ